MNTQRPSNHPSFARALALFYSASLLWTPLLFAAASSEYDLLRQFPPGALTALVAGGEPDADGLVGTHKRNHQWFEAGMQRGGCWFLIGAVVAGDERRADEAWKSIDVAFAHQIDDGGFLSVRKPGDAHEPTPADRVETAFFYLQELGHAILVVQASPMESHFHDRIAALKPRMARACAFIQSGYDGIIEKAGHTANRMFIAAKAFGLCGIILDDKELLASSRKLVEVALARRDADGVFIENRGRDSSYNAVSLLMGQVLNLYLNDPTLRAALDGAMIWERTRVLPTGEVMVAGNTRTGLNQEKSFGGGYKTVNYPEVAFAFYYFGKTHDDPSAIELAEKVRAWNAHSPH